MNADSFIATEIISPSSKVFDRYRFTKTDSSVVEAVGAFDGPVFTAIVDAALNHDAAINMSLGGTIDRSSKDDNASWLPRREVRQPDGYRDCHGGGK